MYIVHPQVRFKRRCSRAFSNPAHLPQERITSVAHVDLRLRAFFFGPPGSDREIARSASCVRRDGKHASRCVDGHHRRQHHAHSHAPVAGSACRPGQVIREGRRAIARGMGCGSAAAGWRQTFAGHRFCCKGRVSMGLRERRQRLRDVYGC